MLIECKKFVHSTVKEEYIEDGSYEEMQTQKIAEETPSPHLQDHQYGQTPCYQPTRRLTQPPPRTEVKHALFIIRGKQQIFTLKIILYRSHNI